MLTPASSNSRQNEGDIPCLSRIEHAYEGLFETARRVADYILQQPTAAIGLSINDLAQRSGVSDTTVLRFTRSLGYRGYREFALALAAATATSVGSLTLDVEINATDDLPTIAQKVFLSEASALSKAWQTLDADALRRTVEALAQARQVHCYAVGGSGLLAVEAVYRLVRLGIDCVAVYDPIQIAIQASRLTPRDVAIGFSQSGRTRDTIEGLVVAREAGATTVCVTSKPRSPIVAVSDIVLVLLELQTVYRGAYLDSKIAELTLVDAITTCLARHLPPRDPSVAERLDESIERMLLSGREVQPRRRRPANIRHRNP